MHRILRHRWLCFLVILLATGSTSQAWPSSSSAGEQITIDTPVTDPIEILFQIGLNELRLENYSSAIRIFESLVELTASPRIRLELARALFLDRRYQESAQVFGDLLRQTELPWAVQENVRAYLEAIDAALGYVKFGFSLVSDDNPRNFTDSQQIRIAGQPLRVIPPKDNREIQGIKYSLNAARVLTKQGALAAYLNTSYLDFPHSQFDRWTADFGLLIRFREWPRIRFRIGLEESYYGGHHLYAFPYAGMIFTPDPILQFETSSELKIGRLSVPGARHLDATNVSLTTITSRALTDSVRISADVYLEQNMTEEKAYSYYGGALGGGLSLLALGQLGFKPYASIGRRIYEADDPFFGETRRETRRTAGARFYKSGFSVLGFRPEIEVRYDENRSNLAYYSYDKLTVQMNFIEQ